MAKKGSLAIPMGGGLNEKALKKRQAKAGGSLKLKLEEGKTKTIQFCFLPTDKDGFKEIEIHQWKEDRKTYHTVPCLGEDICPLCDDDDDDISKTRFQFVTCVYDFKEKQYRIFQAGTLAAGVIALRFKKFKKADTPKKFLKRAWDITRIPGEFKAPDIVLSDRDAKKLDTEKFIDPAKWIEDQVRAYYGDEIPSPGSSLEDDDDDDDDEDEDDEPKRKKKSKKKKSKK